MATTAVVLAPPPARISGMRIALAALVLLAGAVHLVLAPEHLERSVPLGLGFLGFGIAQAAVAALVLRSSARASSLCAFVVSVASLVPLVAAVTVGLPLLPAGAMNGPLGPVEQLDDLSAITAMVEFLAAVLSIRMLRRA